jgi:hypothetical protein
MRVRVLGPGTGTESLIEGVSFAWEMACLIKRVAAALSIVSWPACEMRIQRMDNNTGHVCAWAKKKKDKLTFCGIFGIFYFIEVLSHSVLWNNFEQVASGLREK